MEEKRMLLLSTASNTETDIVMDILKQKGIPALAEAKASGEGLQAFMGFSPYGDDIFVGASDFEKASEAISGVENNHFLLKTVCRARQQKISEDGCCKDDGEHTSPEQFGKSFVLMLVSNTVDVYDDERRDQNNINAPYINIFKQPRIHGVRDQVCADKDIADSTKQNCGNHGKGVDLMVGTHKKADQNPRVGTD